MKHKIPDEVMPTLYLTRDEELWIEGECGDMVERAVESFDAFIAGGRTFPRDKWKRLKAREGFQVYRTRRSFYNSSASSSATTAYSQRSSTSSSADSISSSDSMPFRPATMPPPPSAARLDKAKNPNREFPVVVLTGIVPGTMEDAGYGAVAATEEIWRLRGSYCNDLQRDCKIMATIKRPTLDNPFEFLGVKWSWRKLPAFVQQRDMVYAESTGVVGDPAECETGFTLMHSIELPGIPELSHYDILRMNLSLCYLIRKFDETSIEFYCRAYCIPVGKLPKSIGARIYAEGLLSAVKTMECSYVKKLMWLTQQRRRRGVQYTTQSLESATHCQGCLRHLRLFGGISRPTSQCSCCNRIVCTKCTSERKIVLDVSDEGEVTQKSLPFCMQCVMEARALPATDIALATVETWHDEIRTPQSTAHFQR